MNSEAAKDSLTARVEAQLARYEHPLFRFSARPAGSSVVLVIELAEGLRVQHHYEIILQQREIEDRQFPWSFQRLLYDCLHDLIVEMFERNPQMREDQ